MKGNKLQKLLRGEKEGSKKAFPSFFFVKDEFIEIGPNHLRIFSVCVRICLGREFWRKVNRKESLKVDFSLV